MIVDVAGGGESKRGRRMVEALWGATNNNNLESSGTGKIKTRKI